MFSYTNHPESLRSLLASEKDSAKSFTSSHNTRSTNTLSDAFTLKPSQETSSTETIEGNFLVENGTLPYYIEALDSGFHWDIGQPTQVSYTFDSIDGNGDNGGGFFGNFTLFNADQIQATENAIVEFEKIANIEFIATPDNSSTNTGYDIAFRGSDTTAFGGYGGLPDEQNGSDIIVNNIYSAFDGHWWYGLEYGNGGFVTFLHEIGHALGLAHPHDEIGNSTILPPSEDNTNNTIMSYNSGDVAGKVGPNAPHTLQIYDIATLHHIYGANYDYNSGDTTYVIDGINTYRGTYWDGGGQDTFSAINYNGNAVIDLREGIDNISEIGNSSFWVAFDANIENAVGGYGNDNLFGNSLNNKLYGNAGNDTMLGNEGNDDLFGGQGDDSLKGNDGNDYLHDDNVWWDYGNDTLYGGDGDDTINVESGDDYADGGAGDDVIQFTEGYGHGDDTLHGGSGNDYIRGGIGDDIMTGGYGRDSLFGGHGNDALFSFSFGGEGDTSADILYGEGGDDDLIGDDGRDILIGGIGNDYLEGGDGKDIFVFNSTDGHDILLDFTTGSDKINLRSFVDAFSQLDFDDAGNNTYITVQGYFEINIFVIGLNSGDFSASDFLFDGPNYAEFF